MITFQVLSSRSGWQVARDGRIIGVPVEGQDVVLCGAYNLARNHPEEDACVEVHAADSTERRIAFYPKVG